MKASWDRIVISCLSNGPLTDKAIERYELEGRYGKDRQAAARCRQEERIARNVAVGKRIIDAKKRVKSLIHDLL